MKNDAFLLLRPCEKRNPSEIERELEIRNGNKNSEIEIEKKPKKENPHPRNHSRGKLIGEVHIYLAI